MMSGKSLYLPFLIILSCSYGSPGEKELDALVLTGESEILCEGIFDPCGEWEPVLSASMPVFDQGGKLLMNMDQIFENMIFSDNAFGIQWKHGNLTPDGHFPQYFKKISGFMVPPGKGELVALDPALLVAPPEAYRIGFVPIVTGQKQVVCL